MTADAATKKSWELFEHGLLVFERALGPSGPTRLLVSRVESCTEPECTCRAVFLRALSFEVADANAAMEQMRDGLGQKFEKQAMHARLDIEIGRVEPDTYDGRVPLSSEWVDYLRSQIDGELLDLLHARWLRTKEFNRRPDEEVFWPSLERGELVSWDETHPHERQDLYEDGGATFAVDDLYCVNPDCTCSKVRVVFAELSKDGPDYVGSVGVELPVGKIIERDAAPKRKKVVDRLLSALLARHKIAERLASRRVRMQELARGQGFLSRQPVRRAADRVGPNAPCPCGSGKKYKRCCDR